MLKKTKTMLVTGKRIAYESYANYQENGGHFVTNFW